MDKLARQLREDAANINVEVSAELENRIRASLHGITPERARESEAPQRPRSTWWASSLTGIAAVTIVIVLLNLNQPEPPVADIATQSGNIFQPQLIINPAVMTAPLRKELENLEADLKKAEQAVRKEIGLFP
ncbi:MAG: hypothetical protein IIC62_00120 [Proteobacteria bacterium]|nr:hypothetical protein [Pseudomonadota bacterium]